VATSHLRRDLMTPARTVYEQYRYKLGRRNSKGWVMAQGQPPCHHSKSGRSFSVNLDHGGWHCHGCGSHGSLIDFVMLSDNCSFKEACQRLGAWDESPSPETVRKLAEQGRERERVREKAAAAKEAERHQRIQLRDECLTAHQVWQRASTRLSELRKGATPVSPDEEEQCWHVLSLVLPDLRDSEKRYCKASGLDDPE
jgi:hypothetical protein